MSVRLRLRKTGTRNKPCYRIVATDSRSPRDGRFIEILGFYDPRRHQERVDLERVDYWLGVGAQPSDTVNDIIKRARSGKTLEAPAKPVAPPPAPVEEEAPAEEAAAEAPTEEVAAEAPAEEAAAEAPAEEAAAEEPAAEEAPAEEPKAEAEAEAPAEEAAAEPEAEEEKKEEG